MTRNLTGVGVRLELDFDKGEVRIRRKKNGYTRKNRLGNLAFPMTEITAVELQAPAPRQYGRMAVLVRGARLLSAAGVDQTYVEFSDYPPFYEGVMGIKARFPAVLLYNRVGAAPPAGVAAAPPAADSRPENDLPAEHRETLDRLEELNRAIPDRTLSDSIDRIRFLAGEIFKVIAQRPEQKPQVRKFMTYYLPTAVKLLETYAELEQNRVQTPSVLKTKQEIENAAAALVAAFEKELDGLFAADALDVKTDIQVLETMLTRDGLTDSPLSENREKG